MRKYRQTQTREQGQCEKQNKYFPVKHFCFTSRNRRKLYKIYNILSMILDVWAFFSNQRNESKTVMSWSFKLLSNFYCYYAVLGKGKRNS